MSSKIDLFKLVHDLNSSLSSMGSGLNLLTGDSLSEDEKKEVLRLLDLKHESILESWNLVKVKLKEHPEWEEL